MHFPDPSYVSFATAIVVFLNTILPLFLKKKKPIECIPHVASKKTSDLIFVK
jgi:hypothetical protein